MTARAASPDRRRLAWTAGAGLAVFALSSADLLLRGPLTTRLDPWINGLVLAADARGVPVGDLGSLLSLPGAGPVDAALVAVACIVLAAWRRWGQAVVIALVSTGAGRLVDVLKNLFERGFPPGHVSLSSGAGAVAAQVRNPPAFIGSHYAFPSGHTIGATVAVSLAILVPLAAWTARRATDAATARRWRRQAIVLCVGIALVTGIARVLVTAHWAMDVVAAWGLGLAIVCGTLAALERRAAPLGSARPGRPVRVLGFTGMPGSGKSEAMEVAKARGIPVVRMGDLIWEEVERRGLPRDAKHVGDVANEMRQTHGKDVWSLRTVDRVKELARGKKVVIIDGVRSDAEVETFRRQLGGDFVLVAIHTDRHHRFERMLARGRADDPKDESVLQARDVREIGWGMAQCIALADEMIVNDASLPEFRSKVEALLDRLAAA